MDSNLESHACEATVLSLLALTSSPCCVEAKSKLRPKKICSPRLRTNWSPYILNLSTWARRGLLLRFSSDAIRGNCRPAKSLKRGLPYFRDTGQNLTLRPESARMFTRVLLTFLQWPIRESHGNPSFVRTTIYKTTPLMFSLYFRQRVTSECARSPGYDCPLRVNVFRVAQWRRDNRIGYLQADYDVSRRLPETARFCDV